MTPSEIKEMAEYALSHTRKELLKKYQHVPNKNIGYIRALLGIARKALSRSTFEKNKAEIAEYAKDHTAEEIRQHFGYATLSSVYVQLKKHGIEYKRYFNDFTEFQIRGIAAYRAKGWTVKAIATKLGLKEAHVRDYCFRHGVKLSEENRYKNRVEGAAMARANRWKKEAK